MIAILAAIIYGRPLSLVGSPDLQFCAGQAQELVAQVCPPYGAR
jgi:hypothetical protein